MRSISYNRANGQFYDGFLGGDQYSALLRSRVGNLIERFEDKELEE
jgi:hypothetical protein